MGRAFSVVVSVMMSRAGCDQPSGWIVSDVPGQVAVPGCGAWPGQIMRSIIHSGAMHRLMLYALSLHQARVMFIMTEPVFCVSCEL